MTFCRDYQKLCNLYYISNTQSFLEIFEGRSRKWNGSFFHLLIKQNTSPPVWKIKLKLSYLFFGLQPSLFSKCVGCFGPCSEIKCLVEENTLRDLIFYITLYNSLSFKGTICFSDNNFWNNSACLRCLKWNYWNLFCYVWKYCIILV